MLVYPCDLTEEIGGRRLRVAKALAQTGCRAFANQLVQVMVLRMVACTQAAHLCMPVSHLEAHVHSYSIGHRCHSPASECMQHVDFF